MDWNKLPDVFDIKKLAEFLDIGNNTAYELARQKGFPAFRVGRQFRISKDGLRTWIEKNSQSNS